MMKASAAVLGLTGLLAAALIAPTAQAADTRGAAAKADPPSYSQYDATWTRSWRNQAVRLPSGEAPQGTIGRSTFVSQIGFPDTMHTDLLWYKEKDPTVRISRVEVKFDAISWSLKNGAADIGVHGSATAPAKFKYSGSLTSPNWPVGYGRVVTLPGNWAPGFNTGTTKGITLGGKAQGQGNLVFYGALGGSENVLVGARPFIRVFYENGK